MKILSICASGAGTSMIMKTKIKKLNQLNTKDSL